MSADFDFQFQQYLTNMPDTEEEAFTYVAMLRRDLAEALDKAEKFEFIALVREKIESYENNWSDEFSDCAYEAAIKAKYPEESNPVELKDLSRHYKKWMWILFFGDEIGSPQIQRIRNCLGMSRSSFHRFAKSMQRFYGMFSDSVWVSVFFTKYVKKEKFSYYLEHLGDDFREDISILLNTD